MNCFLVSGALSFLIGGDNHNLNVIAEAVLNEFILTVPMVESINCSSYYFLLQKPGEGKKDTRGSTLDQNFS